MRDLIETIVREELRMHSYFVSDSCIDSIVDRIEDAVYEESINWAGPEA